MVPVSAAFRRALESGAPQRVLLAFPDAIISNEDIDVEGGVDFREVYCSEQDITIGLTPASEITFAVFNEDGHYDDFAFGTFDAYIGVRVSTRDNGSAPTRCPAITLYAASLSASVNGNGHLETYELCPLGRFIAPRPSVIRNTLIDVQAYDQMTLFDVDMPSAQELGITYPVTAGELLQALCDQAGVAAVSYTFLNSDIALSAEPSIFKSLTMREVLAYIAEAAGANARFNRRGQLELAWLTEQQSVFDEHCYTEFESSWYATPRVDRLHVRNEDSTAETVIGSGNNTYMLQNNPFLRQEDASQGFSVIVSPSRISVYANDTASFTAEILGVSTATVGWQRSQNNVSWEDTSDTGATLSFTASQQTCQYYYRAKVVDSVGNTIYSNSVKATLKGVRA